MLKVERKKKKGRTPFRILWVIGAAALLGLCVFAAVRLNRDTIISQLPEETPAGGSIERRSPEEIVRIEILPRGKVPLELIRGADGEMHLKGEASVSLNRTMRERLEDAMANVVYEAVLSEEAADYRDHPEDFGLDDPLLTARAEYADGGSVTLRIGADSGLEDEHYHFMTVDGDDRLFAVASSVLDDLPLEAELLRDVEQPVIHTARLDRIAVLDGNGETVTEWELRGAVTDQDAADSWFLTVPFVYPADEEAIVNLKKNTGNLVLGICVGESADERLSEWGLDHPRAEILLHLAAGSTGQVTEEGVYDVRDWEEETIRFIIGGARNEWTDYVRWGNQVYTMNHFSLQPFLETDPMDSAARYPVLLPLSSVQRIRVETETGTTEYELTRTAYDDGEEPETHVTRNGEEIPWTVFEAAYDRWMVVTVSGRLPAGWEPKEIRTRYFFESLSGKTHTVELSPYDALHDAVTLDGCTVFYLVRGGMGELP